MIAVLAATDYTRVYVFDFTARPTGLLWLSGQLMCYTLTRFGLRRILFQERYTEKLHSKYGSTHFFEWGGLCIIGVAVIIDPYVLHHFIRYVVMSPDMEIWPRWRIYTYV